MNRKMLLVVGVFVAVFGLSLGSADAEARCGRQRNRCCQNGSYGVQQAGYYGNGQARNWGAGCGMNRNCGYQQTGNQGCQQVACCAAQTAGYAQLVDGDAGPAVNAPAPTAPVEAAPAPIPSN